MGDLPKGWVDSQLVDVVSARKGKKPAILSKELVNDFVPYLDIQAIEKEQVRSYAEASSSRLATPDDLLVVWDGARSGWVGLGRKGAIGSTMMALLPKFGERKYLYRWLQSQFDHINKNPRGTGIPHVDPEIFWSLEVPIAPLPEQRRIVAKLEKLLHKVDTCKERLDRLPGILKRFRQSVLSAACSGRLTADWREKNKDEALQKAVIPVNRNDDEGLPEGWQTVLSGNLFSFVTSGSRGWAKYYSDDGPLFIRVGNLDHESIHFDLRYIQRVQPPKGTEGVRTRVQINDILISITADVGMIALVPSGFEEAYINQHIALARPVEGYYSKYIAWYLTSQEGGLRQFQDLQRGATKVGLGLDDIKNVEIPLPPLPEQHEIVCRVEALFQKADEIEARYKKAKAFVDKLTQSILAKAFRGELVPQDPNDEPASKLLERIKAERATIEKTGKKVRRNRK